MEHMHLAVKELGLIHHFNYTTHKQGVEGLLVDDLMDTEFLLSDMFRVRILILFHVCVYGRINSSITELLMKHVNQF